MRLTAWTVAIGLTAGLAVTPSQAKDPWKHYHKQQEKEAKAYYKHQRKQAKAWEKYERKQPFAWDRYEGRGYSW